MNVVNPVNSWRSTLLCGFSGLPENRLLPILRVGGRTGYLTLAEGEIVDRRGVARGAKVIVEDDRGIRPLPLA